MVINAKRLAYMLDKSDLALPKYVVKRDGSKVSFDIARIEKAIQGCYGDLKSEPNTSSAAITEAVGRLLAVRFAMTVPSVEDVQNLVETALLGAGEVEAAREYIRYRDAHAAKRALVPETIRDQFQLDKAFFPTPIQEFQFYDKYSRFNWDKMRRETWLETVDRVVDYLRWLVESNGKNLPDAEFERIGRFIREQKAMPSMRALAMAGDPAKRNSLAIYNCSYMPVKDVNVFAEAMLVSMAGCGVGFSVERQHVEQFPRIKRQTGVVHEHTVEDSSAGWAQSTLFLLERLFDGEDVQMDYYLVRPAGTPLLIKGGTASGPAPLKFVHDYLRTKVIGRQGSYLRTLDAHDMMCAVGGAAVSGGVRRTAMISLFDWDDHDMRTCKNVVGFDQVRWNANNSAVWPDGLSQIEVVDQMMEMVRGGRGEPGIFSRVNANRTKPARRSSHNFGTNPCGEINLREFGLCNLTIAVARPDDTLEELKEKVEVAAIIGTIQSMATTFPGMRDEWRANCEDERLLGVDITGQRDCDLLRESNPAVRQELEAHVIRVNAAFAFVLGINPAAAATCNKPSGNSSTLLNTSSGIHARWAPFYKRRTRVSASTPLFRVLKDAGVPMSPENGQVAATADTWVVTWPMCSPAGVRTRKDFTAIEQCDFWLENKLYWTEHNPSVTITYQQDEVLDVIGWVWTHRDEIGGMAFLPADDAKYEQAPYEEISEDEYVRLMSEFPVLDFSLLYAYEHTDMTTAASELACLAGQCDI